MTAPGLFLTARSLTELGVRHGFSTRAGGVSVSPFASLNLGGAVGDDPAAVAANRERLRTAAGVGAIAQVSQVHGERLVEVGADEDLSALVQEEADGLVARAAGVAVGVRTADCVPLLICAAGEGGALEVAALHAGWRGTLAKIAARGLTALRGTTALRGADGLRVVIGPSIRVCCYEVDSALAARFTSALGEATVDPRRGEKPHLDLVEANLRVLEAAGLPRERVEVLNTCTACDPERFFSHRRDRGRTGRHLSFIEVPSSGRVSFP